MSNKKPKNPAEPLDDTPVDTSGAPQETANAESQEPVTLTERDIALMQKQIEDSAKALEEEKAKSKELNDRMLRIAAEYDNFRRRAKEEKEALYADATADAMAAILPVLDNLERALQSTDNQTALADGVTLIHKQFLEILSKLKVEEIPALGHPFDPEVHNAVMHDENLDFDENTVSEVFMKGYKCGNKVIRHAMVKVAN